MAGRTSLVPLSFLPAPIDSVHSSCVDDVEKLKIEWVGVVQFSYGFIKRYRAVIDQQILIVFQAASQMIIKLVRLKSGRTGR